MADSRLTHFGTKIKQLASNDFEHLCSTKILKPRTKLFFVNILDGNECFKKIKLFPKVEHGQIFIGSLFEYNKNIKGL